MDQPRITANQRLDLVDIARWLADDQEGFAYLVKVLGDPEYYTGATRDVQKRPLILNNFRVMAAGGLVINVWSTWTVAGQIYHACIFGPEGERLTGPNCSVTKAHVVTNAAPGGVDRYLIARRLAVDTTNEARQYYTAVGGKTTTNTDTETWDDWEVSEALDETGLNFPASQQVALRDAGWVDISTFQTDGIGAVSAISSYWNEPSMLVQGAGTKTTWTGVNPNPSQYFHNLASILFALQSVVARMRAGSIALAPRDWFRNPNYDAAFEEEGGIRFAGGITATVGLVDTQIRTQLGGGTYDTIVVRPYNVVTSADLLTARAKGFIASANIVGGIDPSNWFGYMYSYNVDGKAAGLTDIPKYWDVNGGELCPHNQVVDPWSAGAVNWVWRHYNPGATVAVRWEASIVGGAPGTSTSFLILPIQVPDGCMLVNVEFVVGVLIGLPDAASDKVTVSVSMHSMTKTTGVISNHTTGVTRVYAYSTVGAGSPWRVGGGNKTVAVALLEGTDAGVVVNNAARTYFARIWITDVAGVGGGSYILVDSATVKTLIREASHVY